MPLTVGNKAPDFILSTKTADGAKYVKSSESFGKRKTLLLFFPMAFTATCTTEMCDVSNSLFAYSMMNATVCEMTRINETSLYREHRISDAQTIRRSQRPRRVLSSPDAGVRQSPVQSFAHVSEYSKRSRHHPAQIQPKKGPAQRF